MGRLFNRTLPKKAPVSKPAVSKLTTKKVLSVKDKKFLHDDEFGDIEIRRTSGGYVRLKIQTNGKLVAQLPRFASLSDVKRLLENSRQHLRQNMSRLPNHKNYNDGDQIGKSHRLRIRQGARDNVSLHNLEIVVTAKDSTLSAARNQLIKDGIAKALRKEAKAYLPRRLRYLAMNHGFSYKTVRFTHAKSRWGSCSSTGTISLNITLMSLPNDLIDYVLLHELNHTRHMDHSKEFWMDLEKICPNAKRRRTWLKQFSPYL